MNIQESPRKSCNPTVTTKNHAVNHQHPRTIDLWHGPFLLLRQDSRLSNPKRLQEPQERILRPCQQTRWHHIWLVTKPHWGQIWTPSQNHRWRRVLPSYKSDVDPRSWTSHLWSRNQWYHSYIYPEANGTRMGVHKQNVGYTQGFPPGRHANFRDALNKSWYSQLKSVHTAYRNTTPKLKTQPKLVQYYHALAGFPTKPLWLKAIKNKQYTSWLGFTWQAANKHYPESKETLKGHGWKTKSGLRSTKMTTESDDDDNNENANAMHLPWPTIKQKRSNNQYLRPQQQGRVPNVHQPDRKISKKIKPRLPVHNGINWNWQQCNPRGSHEKPFCRWNDPSISGPCGAPLHCRTHPKKWLTKFTANEFVQSPFQDCFLVIFSLMRKICYTQYIKYKKNKCWKVTWW